jgi:hypothetical protein
VIGQSKHPIWLRTISKGTNETAALDKILSDASKGTHFISDRDARNPGGMHPNAHLG